MRFQPIRRDKPWGHELIIADTSLYTGKILHIRAGRRLSLQYHEYKDESIYILRGRVRIEYSGVIHEMRSGDAIRIYPLDHHRIEAITQVTAIETSTPCTGVVRLEDDYQREEHEE